MTATAERLVQKLVRRVGRIPSRVQQRIEGARIRAAHRDDPIPIPPARLIRKVAGTDDVAWFLHSGRAAAESLRETLASVGRSVEGCRSVLDFGCGVGRVLRHWAGVSGPRFHGSDYNPDLVAWCRANLPFVDCRVNAIEGRIDAGDEAFDLVYALSVFTHLTEPGQRHWMDEMRRVIAPGGCLYVTTHGTAYLPQLTEEEREQFARGELVVRGGTHAGSNDCATFHPERYVHEAMAAGFEVLAFVPQGARGNPVQDAYLLRRR